MIRRWSAAIRSEAWPAFGYGVIAGVLLLSAQGIVAAMLGLLLLGVVVLVSVETTVRRDVVRQMRDEASQVDVANQLRRLL